jgi:hypothetical protein
VANATIFHQIASSYKHYGNWVHMWLMLFINDITNKYLYSMRIYMRKDPSPGRPVPNWPKPSRLD